MHRPPIHHFDYIFHQIGIFQRCVGCFVLDPLYQPTLHTRFLECLNVSFIIFNCYTLATFETSVRLKCLAIFGMGAQGITKFPTVIYNARTIGTLVTFLRTVYVGSRRARQSADAVLLRWVRRMRTLLGVGAALIMVSALLFVPETLLESWRAGQRVPMLSAMVPGVAIDAPGNWSGYGAVFVYHTLLVMLGSIGTCSVDMLLVVLVVHMCPLAEIFAQFLDDMNAALRLQHNGTAAAADSVEFRRAFRNILLVHRAITGYLDAIASVYFYVFFAEINSDALSLCVLIVCTIRLDWIGVYPLYVLFMAKLFAYCMLGTIAELCTDRMYAALVACDWYRLPMVQRRQFAVMLMAAQRPAVLMAGTVPLNLDTFVNVLKTVYTVGMLLIESMD